MDITAEYGVSLVTVILSLFNHDHNIFVLLFSFCTVESASKMAPIPIKFLVLLSIEMHTNVLKIL